MPLEVACSRADIRFRVALADCSLSHFHMDSMPEAMEFWPRKDFVRQGLEPFGLRNRTFSI